MEKLEAKTLCISNHAKSSLPFVTIFFEFLKILNEAIFSYTFLSRSLTTAIYICIYIRLYNDFSLSLMSSLNEYCLSQQI